MHGALKAMVLSGMVLALSGEASLVHADGGSIRVSDRRGNRLITVFTSPTPVRTGPVDISVLIQDAGTGKALTDVPVVIRAHPLDDERYVASALATTEAATNKILQAASLEFSRPGLWRVEVSVRGLDQDIPIGWEMEVAEALPGWLTMGPWITWPLAVIGLFAVHEWLVRKRLTMHKGDSRLASPE